MNKLPEEVVRGWGEKEGPIVLGTVDKEGKPNLIYASVVKKISDGRIAVADNYFDKTLANIQSGSAASILFITKSHNAYQLKGDIEYHIEGELFNEMLSWADPKHPRKGVAILNTQEVYRGSERLA